jgi:hypothetical protein
VKPGDMLWYAPYRGNAHLVTIERVGRKWAHTLCRMKVDIHTGAVSGGQYSSPGKCWASRQECESHATTKANWMQLRNEVYSRVLPPPDVTIDVIEKVRELLGFK